MIRRKRCGDAIHQFPPGPGSGTVWELAALQLAGTAFTANGDTYCRPPSLIGSPSSVLDKWRVAQTRASKELRDVFMEWIIRAGSEQTGVTGILTTDISGAPGRPRGLILPARGRRLRNQILHWTRPRTRTTGYRCRMPRNVTGPHRSDRRAEGSIRPWRRRTLHP